MKAKPALVDRREILREKIRILVQQIDEKAILRAKAKREAEKRELTDAYIRRRLHWRDAPDDIVRLKRAEILLRNAVTKGHRK